MSGSRTRGPGERPARAGGDETVRAFVALELDERLRVALAGLQQSLKPRLGSCRLVRPDGVHLTLRFLGQARPDQVEALGRSLLAAAGACPALEFAVAGLGTFPERSSPRVLWVGVELPPEALALQRACERAACDAGFGREERPFRPHLTLGRWRERAPRPELPAVDLGRTRVDTLVLYRSVTAPGGAVYTPLARFPLGE